MKRKIILASQSPRRAHLLEEAGISFSVHPSNAREDITETEPHTLTRALAKKKALIARKKFPKDIILAADTVVHINGQILGKPTTPEEAFAMLSLLAGNKHQIITGITIMHRDTIFIDSDEAGLELHPLAPEQIRHFLNATNPYDKAGGYSIEEMPPEFIRSLKGDKSTILGLPLTIVRKYLDRLTELDDST